MNTYRHIAEFEVGPTHVAIRKPKFSVSKGAKRDVDSLREGKMTKLTARRRDRIRIASAAIVRN